LLTDTPAEDSATRALHLTLIERLGAPTRPTRGEVNDRVRHGPVKSREVV
jgi:hypothetical protein